MFVIATDSTAHHDTVLFLVDRRKNTKGFWSHRTENVLLFDAEGAAKAQAARFKFNNPRVMTLDKARSISLAQYRRWLDSRGDAPHHGQD